jgi:proline racemase
VAIRPDQANTLIDTGRRIRAALNEYVGDRVVHPENPGIRGVSQVMFTAEPTNPKARTRRTWSCTVPAAWTVPPEGRAPVPAWPRCTSAVSWL